MLTSHLFLSITQSIYNTFHIQRSTFHVLTSLTLLTLLILTACSLTPTVPNRPPERIYLFDASDLHLNHYAHCTELTGKADGCDETIPPPAGKNHQDLLREYDTLIFLTTLQGLVNRNQPQLYLNHAPQDGDTASVDMFWLEQYQKADQSYGWLAQAEIIELSSLEEVLDTFADGVEGVVLWDTAVPATLNVATTIAGVENLAVLRAGSEISPLVTGHLEIKQSLVDMFKPGATTLPGSNTPSSGSAKNDAYLWAKENFLDTDKANAQFLAYIEDGWPAARYAQQQMSRGGVYALERDYVVQQQGFAFDLSPWADEAPLDDPDQPLGTDRQTLEMLLAAAEAQTSGDLIKVWGFVPWYEKYSTVVGGQHLPVDAEWESTWLFSQHGAYLQGGGGDVFGMAMANVSLHQFAPHPMNRSVPGAPTKANLIKQGYLTPQGAVSPEHTFVLFYAGDYDLGHPLQVMMANYADRPWQDDHRGDIPLAWGLNPGLIEDIPGVLDYLYSTKTEQDYFVAANSGAGYLNPDGLTEGQLLRWLWRSNTFYKTYGYNVQGFLLNGHGAHLSQRRLDSFTLIAPVGILSPDYQTDKPWPRLQRSTPVLGLPTETLGGTPDFAAHLVHNVYNREVLSEGRPPFLAFRSSFKPATFLWETRERMLAHDTEGLITNAQGQIIHPNYTVVDPYTFFFLLKRSLE